jgi:hypothetical protein
MELLNTSGSFDHKQVIKNWMESGLLDGITSEYTGSMASMMESEAMQILREQWKKEDKTK